MLTDCDFRLVLADIEVGMTRLLPQDHPGLCLVTDNPYSSVHYSHRQAEAIILFNLNALAEIANTKNNLIGVSRWGKIPVIGVSRQSKIHVSGVSKQSQIPMMG